MLGANVEIDFVGSFCSLQHTLRISVTAMEKCTSIVYQAAPDVRDEADVVQLCFSSVEKLKLWPQGF